MRNCIFIPRLLTGIRNFSRQHGQITKGALKGLSDTNPSEIGPRKGGRPSPLTTIFTLDPKKFAEKNQQRLLLGGRRTVRLYISLHNQSSLVKLSRMQYDQISQTSSQVSPLRTRKLLPYPPDTNAFLYYFAPQDKPRIAGEIRLRVTSSDDPASFESGSDLLGSNGQAWSRPLLYLPKYYPPLYEKLREEGFVPDDLDRNLSTLPSLTPSYRGRRSLFTLNDTFIVNFNRKLSLVLSSEKHIENLLFSTIFVDQSEMWNGAPYTGSALARFERSTLLEHKGTRTIVLRFVKIITPVKCVIPQYNGILPIPKEGELFLKSRRRRNGPVKVWSLDIDKSESCSSRGLRLIWDA